MNLFRLHDFPSQAAIFNQDLHVRKIILEAGGMLCNCYSEEQLKSAPKTQLGKYRKHSWFNHPLSKWVRLNINNYKWTLIHAIALCNEYEYRFGKIHFGQKLIEWCLQNRPELPDEEETDQPQCFSHYPDLITAGNPVEGYRKYYNAAKLQFNFRNKIVKATWTKRDIPFFVKFLDNRAEKC